MANGRLAGKKRIAFETAVQAVYFDEILGEANRRLAGMTNNRYRLVRHEDAERLNDRGLELGVIDGHTGKERHVSTLSGGEGFTPPWHWRWAYPTWCSAARRSGVETCS